MNYTKRINISVYSLIFFSFVFNHIICEANIQCNNKTNNRADANVAKILTLGQKGRRFPETESQAMAYCSDTLKLIKSVEKYAKTCLKNTSQRVSQVLFLQVKKQMRQLCKKSAQQRRQRMIKLAPCANRAAKDFNVCNTRFIDKLIGISAVNDDKKIPFLCCEYQKIFECIHSRGEEFCTEDELDEATQLIRGTTGGLLGGLCTEYREDSDKCERLGAVPKKPKHQRRSKSFYMPLIHVLKSFDNKE